MIENLAWLGHDSFRIGGSKTIYIDPWRLQSGSPAADLILVTHSHRDHLSKGDIALIGTPRTIVVGPAEVIGQIAGEKIVGETITIRPGETITAAGVTVSAVPAYNTNKFRAPGKLFHPREDGKVGYIVEHDGRRIYHAGDTDVIPEMAAVTVDIALLPVSGTYVMTADEAALAAATIQAGVIVPMHFGTIVGSLADAQRFAELSPTPVEILAPPKD
jgi:L-ascorbate metabolism protein UlaG (beta-lactamase superfamily)